MQTHCSIFRRRQRAYALKVKAKKPLSSSDRDRTIEIYSKAAEIFHEKGFDATSMSIIASAVDLTKAGLYYYIESKEDLLYAIVNFAMERLEATVIEPSRELTDPQKRLHSIVTRHAKLLTEGNKAITILTDEIDGLKPKHRKQILDRKRAYFDWCGARWQSCKRKANCAISTRPSPPSACSARSFGCRAGFVSMDHSIATRLLNKLPVFVTGGLLKGKGGSAHA